MEANINYLTEFVDLYKATNSSVYINNEKETITDYSALPNGRGSNFDIYKNTCHQYGGSFVTSSFKLKCTKDDGSSKIESVEEIPSCIGIKCIGDEQGKYLGSVQIEANKEKKTGTCEFYESSEKLKPDSTFTQSNIESAASKITSRNLVLATASISLSFLFTV
eukprot:CAMPEP_0194277662 /NCGR_PEP_ID=MMETSP0169-20130528/9929_1 /TAXON_ID=218684 /ORGANISM="Corethron pennatum, Strain L29A3" /LENGTH=163 /DNA_ID=CAMNT_0039021679 /DNA_START=224 /DNA_END=715 /DNA_ORIENTATION=+